jgi:restriction endonuclease S subunit
LSNTAYTQETSLSRVWLTRGMEWSLKNRLKPSFYLIRFRLKDQAYIRYIQYWLRSDGYWKLVASRHAGTTRASLNAQVLSSFPLIIPRRPIASAFGEIISALRNKVVVAVDEARTLATLRDALLPKLICGEIRVEDAERFLKERGL